MDALWARELAALDFETTGLSPQRGDRVLEVAVVRGRVGAEPRVWSALVDPGRPVGASSVHGITDAMVRGRPSFRAVLPELLARLDGAVLVAHNASFDLGFLRMECERCGVDAPAVSAIDTLALSRRLFAFPSNSLASLRGHFDVPTEREHRAADDALATWRLAWRMLGAVDPERRLTVSGARALCRPRTAADAQAVYRALAEAQARGEPIVIDYHTAEPGRPSRTRRAITVRRLTRSRVEAWCHLRGAERVFRLDRMRLVEVDG